jgi:hypothetical protein
MHEDSITGSYSTSYKARLVLGAPINWPYFLTLVGLARSCSSSNPLDFDKWEVTVKTQGPSEIGTDNTPTLS